MSYAKLYAYIKSTTGGDDYRWLLEEEEFSHSLELREFLLRTTPQHIIPSDRQGTCFIPYKNTGILVTATISSVRKDQSQRSIIERLFLIWELNLQIRYHHLIAMRNWLMGEGARLIEELDESHGTFPEQFPVLDLNNVIHGGAGADSLWPWTIPSLPENHRESNILSVPSEWGFADMISPLANISVYERQCAVWHDFVLDETSIDASGFELYLVNSNKRGSVEWIHSHGMVQSPPNALSDGFERERSFSHHGKRSDLTGKSDNQNFRKKPSEFRAATNKEETLTDTFAMFPHKRKSSYQVRMWTHAPSSKLPDFLKNAWRNLLNEIDDYEVSNKDYWDELQRRLDALLRHTIRALQNKSVASNFYRIVKLYWSERTKRFSMKLDS